MKKIVSVVITALLAYVSSLHAQDKFCYTTEVYLERIKAHPELLEVQNQLEDFTRQSEARRSSGNQTASQVYIIPIVFHIIHNYGTENISDAQVIDQVRILNADFRKQSYDTGSIIPAFKPIAADCEIEFRLATIDPNGNCTNGIDRVASSRTYLADDNSKLNGWPENMYLNVWVVSSLARSSAAAYAYYPGTAHPGADGIIMLSGYVGSIGSGTVGRSRVLTHEIGHYFNLQHVWGNTNNPGVACGDDHVSDTPVTKGWTTCNVNGATCGNVVDNVQNYMEYSYCCSMFTEGQKLRAVAALNSSVAGRNNLWTTNNLIATGTEVLIDQLCSPKTDFKADNLAVCVGTNVQYKDLSWNGHPTSWNWNFPGGTPSSSTDSMPLIQYNTAGFYDVSLVTGNSVGTDSLTKTPYIAVTGNATQTAPFYESFETAGSFPGTDGFVVNPDSGNGWMRVTNAASTGIASIMIDNYSGNRIGEYDEYITPSFDLSSVTALTMDFKLAYARRDTSHNDKLEVFVSINCGKTWTLRYTQVGYNMTTAGIVNSGFVPNASQWRIEHVSIIPFHNQPKVRFKFKNTSAGGNRLYIDDININGVVAGIHENAEAVAGFNVFPNPAFGKFSVEFKLDKSEHVSLKVADALGREVKTLVTTELRPGIYQYAVDDHLEAGVYFVMLEKDGELFAKKLLVTNE